MSARTATASRRDLRKALGGDVADLIAVMAEEQKWHATLLTQTIMPLLGRGFFGRLKWLLLGR